MAELSVEVKGVEEERYAAVPTLEVICRLSEASGDPVQACTVRTQVRIEPQRRHYSDTEAAHLVELFGSTDRFGETLRSLVWTETSTTLGVFTGSTELRIPILCTYDFEVAWAKYLNGLEDGAVSLLLLFSGTVFRMRAGRFVVEPIPWHLEARASLEVATWRAMMDRHFPGATWLRLSRDSVLWLQAYKARHACVSFDQAVRQLLSRAGPDDER
jgi:hypothetical protein